jgi:drug/metabolite transporter (DMT)-like permease
MILAVIWGFSFLFIKVAGEGLTPTTVAGLRVALGAATLLVYLKVSGGSLPSGRRTWFHLFVVAVFANALPFTLLTWAEQDITSALAAVLNAGTPLFTAIATWALLHERLCAPQVLGLAVGITGVAITAGVGAADVGESSAWGAGAAVAAGACYGVGLAWSKRHLMGMPAESAAAGQLVAATVWLAPFAIATTAVEGVDLTPSRVASIVLLGCVGTGVAYVLFYQLLADIGPTRTSLVTYLVPIVAVVVAALALDERLTGRQVVGAVIIVLGLRLVNGPFGLDLPPRLRRSPAALPVLLLVAAVLVGCSGGGPDGAGGCGPAVRERLDPTWTVHLVAGAEEPEYLSDPPTSGPHYGTEPPTGVVDEALTKPLQVNILEVGQVLLQYDPEQIDAATADGVAGADVTVAPNADLDDPVVLTAWTWKQPCQTVDADVVQSFADEHRGDAPGADT